MKYKRIKNVHVRFHKIPSVSQFMSEFTMHSSHQNESSVLVVSKKEWDTCLFLELLGSTLVKVDLTFEVAKNHFGWLTV